jgi:hypothetical protein
MIRSDTVKWAPSRPGHRRADANDAVVVEREAAETMGAAAWRKRVQRARGFRRSMVAAEWR